jgi:hypothetical protein
VPVWWSLEVSKTDLKKDPKDFFETKLMAVPASAEIGADDKSNKKNCYKVLQKRLLSKNIDEQ